MKPSLWLKTLFRSPVRTIVTWVLLLAAAFQFTLSLTDYLSTRKGLQEAKERMKGTLSIEHAPGLDPNAPGNSSHFNLFLMTDTTASGTGMPIFPPENFHPQNITNAELETLTALPGVAGAEIRTMTAGVSGYIRPDVEFHEFCYEARLILEAMVSNIDHAELMKPIFSNIGKGLNKEDSCVLILNDVHLLGGNAAALPVEADGSCRLLVPVFQEETRGQANLWDYSTNASYGRDTAVIFQNELFLDDITGLEPGRRYLFAVRVEPWLSDNAGFIRLVLGDDTLLDWWPYFTDITDLPENYLEGEDYAPLRELIQITNDDWHTFDVVYTGDMGLIRRAADLRLVPAEGRFLEPEDAGKPVCVVNADFAYANGLSLGDTLHLKLGDYPMEQHEVLGAVASTRGRYAENWTEQDFTIVGTWRDINQGARYLKEDQIWAYSDATVFVPSSFLPEGAWRTEYSPGEVTLLVDTDAMGDFVQTQLPALQESGWITYWNDRGWPQMEEELLLVVQAALYKLLAFSAATLLVIALTVYLFISRRSRDYAILRALGLDKGGSGRSLTIPLLCLTLAAVIPGALAGFLRFSRDGAHADPLALAGVPILVLLPMLAALAMVNRMGNTSPLTLLQSKRRQK